MNPSAHLLVMMSLLALAACGDGGGASDTSGDASDDWTSVDGRTTQGIYLCCAPGEERTSCCPPETLPDPEHGRTATCFEYGGTIGACVAEGGSLEAKDICSTCCDGLVRVEMSAPAEGGSCEETGPPSAFICAACGDAHCGSGENRCNCPGDCPTP